VKVLAGLLAVLCAGAVLWYLEPWADEGGTGENPQGKGERAGQGQAAAGQVDPEEFTGSACRRMAGLAARLAEAEESARRFLRAFGREAAGIRPPPRAYGDLARGGRDLIPGRGFLSRYDDGTEGQVRHFAGIAAASTFGGGSATRFISIFFRDDPIASPDGQLTEEGIEFAERVLGGDLAPAETPAWLLENLCRRT
jgi:hypothetical protein